MSGSPINFFRYFTLEMTSYNRDFWMAFGAHQKPTVGDMKMSATANDHMGWMLCDGRSVNVSDYQFLFNVIGYSFGSAANGEQFVLPNPSGRVPGFAGTGRDINNSTFTAIMGLSTGEYMHQLTIPELASHNHGVASTIQSSFNNSTSVEFTDISVLTSTTGVYDSGHNHVYVKTNDNNHENAVSLTQNQNNSGADYDATTNTGNANIVDPGHTHPINDPGHAHTLNSAGLDQRHNNVQPTLFVGNMFIYNGKPTYGAWPYTTGSNIW